MGGPRCVVIERESAGWSGPLYSIAVWAARWAKALGSELGLRSQRRGEGCNTGVGHQRPKAILGVGK